MKYFIMIRRINNASVSIFFLIILNGLFNRKVSNVNAHNLRRGASDDAMGEQIQNDRSLIIGGDEARDFPRSIVFLSDRVDDLQCGGTLISPTIVLAAGHCEISLVTEAVFNRFSYIPLDKRKSNFKDNGSISNEEIRIKVKEEIQHPEYKRRGFHNDVMLIVLERSPNENIDVIEEPLLERANGNSSDDPNENFDERPWRDANSPDESHDESHDEVTQQIPRIPYMKLHMSSHPTLDDLANALESSQSERRDRSHRFYQYGDRPKTTPLKLKALGWGHTANGQGSEPSEVLREVAVSYVRNEVCNEAAENAVISYEGKITDDMMCTWHPGRDTCHGDSGGPIILENPNKSHGEKFIQVGIVSWGEDCADEIFPGGKFIAILGMYSAEYTFYWDTSSLSLLSRVLLIVKTYRQWLREYQNPSIGSVNEFALLMERMPLNTLDARTSTRTLRHPQPVQPHFWMVSTQSSSLNKQPRSGSRLILMYIPKRLDGGS